MQQHNVLCIAIFILEISLAWLGNIPKINS